MRVADNLPTRTRSKLSAPSGSRAARAGLMTPLSNLMTSLPTGSKATRALIWPALSPSTSATQEETTDVPLFRRRHRRRYRDHRILRHAAAVGAHHHGRDVM